MFQYGSLTAKVRTKLYPVSESSTYNIDELSEKWNSPTLEEKPIINEDTDSSWLFISSFQ